MLMGWWRAGGGSGADHRPCRQGKADEADMTGENPGVSHDDVTWMPGGSIGYVGADAPRAERMPSGGFAGVESGCK